MKIILLVGLPGSGKTTYGQSLGFPFIDDLIQNGGFDALHRIDPSVKTLVVSDSGFIWLKATKIFLEVARAILPVTEVGYVVWENDPVTCYENVVRRNDGRIISKPAIEQMSKTYVYPEGAIPRPIFKGE
jgi:hypothetical protein